MRAKQGTDVHINEKSMERKLDLNTAAGEAVENVLKPIGSIFNDNYIKIHKLIAYFAKLLLSTL